MPATFAFAGMARSYLKPLRNRYSFVFIQSLSHSFNGATPLKERAHSVFYFRITNIRAKAVTQIPNPNRDFSKMKQPINDFFHF